MSTGYSIFFNANCILSNTLQRILSVIALKLSLARGCYLVCELNDFDSIF